MNIEGTKVLVLGGYGLVGMAVCRELLERKPREIQVHSLRHDESEEAREQLLPFAGISELHPGDAIPTNFKTSDQAYYVLQGELELYAGATLAGTVAGGTEEARFPLSHLQTSFDSARARGSVRLLRVDQARV